MEAIGCVRTKMFVRSLIPRNRAFEYRNAPVSHRFVFIRGSKMLRNTPKHHFVSNGGYLVCLSENVRRKFDTPKPCIRVTKCNNFSSFCIHSCIKMLHYTPKHHYGYNRGYWVCSCENFRRNFGTTKPCIRVPKRTSFSSFCMLRGSEMLQTTPKHHFGSNRGYLGVFLRKHSSEV